MNRHTIRTSIFISAMLAASAACAGGDIVKCVDKDGHVTLTDTHCNEGAAQHVLAASEEAPAASKEAASAPAVPAVRKLAVRRYVLPLAELPPTGSLSLPAASRPLARDVETLKAARLSMQVLDGASAVLRRQRLAGLN